MRDSSKPFPVLAIRLLGRHFYVSSRTRFRSHSLFGVNTLPLRVCLCAAVLLIISHFLCFFSSARTWPLVRPHFGQCPLKEGHGVGQIARRERVGLAGLGWSVSLRNRS